MVSLARVISPVEIDLEMVDYDEFRDVVTLRLSTSRDDLELARVTITPDDEAQVVMEVVSGRVCHPEILRRAIQDSLDAEMNAHPMCETWRDLLSHLVPSATVANTVFGI